MNRTLAIIFSFLIVLQVIAMELALAWAFADEYKAMTMDFIVASLYMLFTLTGIASLVFNIRFLVAMRSAKKARYFSNNFISKTVNICFVIAILLWSAIFVVGFYMTFIVAQQTDVSSNRITLLILVLLILTNGYVWQFFGKTKKDFRNRITDSEIESIGQKLL